MSKQIINPPSLVKPSGYSHGIIAPGGRLFFLAGQTALDARGAVVTADMPSQFRQALANLQAVVQAAGAEMTDIVKLTIFVTDLAAYRESTKAIGATYREFFGKYYPAVTLVEVKKLWDDAAMIEIEGIAIL